MYNLFSVFMFCLYAKRRKTILGVRLKLGCHNGQKVLQKTTQMKENECSSIKYDVQLTNINKAVFFCNSEEHSGRGLPQSCKSCIVCKRKEIHQHYCKKYSNSGLRVREGNNPGVTSFKGERNCVVTRSVPDEFWGQRCVDFTEEWRDGVSNCKMLCGEAAGV